MTAGLFISLEGIDGVGKSTQSDLLEEFLRSAGREVLRTFEPGGTELGQEIRHLLLHRKGDVAPRAEALLYAADRAHHRDRTAPDPTSVADVKALLDEQKKANASLDKIASAVGEGSRSNRLTPRTTNRSSRR
mgnify:CR=1 FL=1